jgi:hypothetical protein
MFDDFRRWASRRSHGFPVPEEEFHEQFWNYAKQTRERTRDYIGFENNKLQFFKLRTITYTKSEQSGTGLEPTYLWWENWMAARNAEAGPGCDRGFQTSEVWPFMVVELAFIDGTVGSLSVALGVAGASIIVFTGNGWLAVMSLSMMIFIISAMLSFFVLMGWALGAVEAICLSIMVGLSVDYALHLGHAYVNSPYYDRRHRSMMAVVEVGGSVLGASITTMGSMIVLIFCTIFTFKVIGTIMLMTVLWSISSSLGILICLMSAIGPQGTSGNLVWFFKHRILCREIPADVPGHRRGLSKSHTMKNLLEAPKNPNSKKKKSQRNKLNVTSSVDHTPHSKSEQEKKVMFSAEQEIEMVPMHDEDEENVLMAVVLEDAYEDDDEHDANWGLEF